MDSHSILHRIICDASRIRALRVTCRACGLRQTLQVPGEAYDARLRILIECPRCDTQYVLQGHKFRKLTTSEENRYDRQGQTNRSGASRWRYDA